MLDILHHKWLHVLLLSIYLALEFHAWSQSTQSSDDVAGSIAFDGSSSAVVVRDGTLAEIAAKDLVPGDIVHISEVNPLLLFGEFYLKIIVGHHSTSRWSHSVSR